MSSFVDFAALKERVSVEAAISLLELSLKQRNNQYRGPCPVCQSGGDRALVVTPSKNAFYCFGERTGGDVIAFAAHVRECSVKDAAVFLSECIGEGKCENTDQTETNRSCETVPEERNKGAVRSLQPLSYLQTDHECIRSLGLEEETCQLFRAGYAPKGIMRGRLAVPVHDGQDRLIAYCGRAVKNEDQMWIFPKDFDPSGFIFNAQETGEEEMALLRDPLEVMLATQNGIENAVSFLTETISANQLHLLAELMDNNGCESVHMV